MLTRWSVLLPNNFYFKGLGCNALSDMLFICIWRSIVWVDKSDLLTRLQSSLPNYFYITLTLGYHTLSRWIIKNRFWYMSFHILQDRLTWHFLEHPIESFCKSSCCSSTFLVGYFSCRMTSRRLGDKKIRWSRQHRRLRLRFSLGLYSPSNYFLFSFS